MISGTVVQTLRFSHTVDGTVGTTSWVQLDSSLDNNVEGIEIFDSSGQVFEFGYGAAGSELRAFFIMPGGTNGYTPCQLHKGMRIAIRAIDGPASSAAQLCINFYG